MRVILAAILVVLGLVFAASQPAWAQANFPKMESVTPQTAKVGDVVTVQGENLGKNIVEAVYLTDGQNDIKMEIVEQTPTTIKFRITEKVKPGKYNLMVLTGGDEPRFIEEPIKVTIEAS